MTEKQHGGKRKGAGRKGYNEPTKMMRVPESVVPVVKDMLAKVVELRNYRKDQLEVLRPVAEPAMLARPLFSSSVEAGFPSPADDYIEGMLDLNDYFIENPSSTFYVRVTGESMKNAGIFPGDILIVDRARHPVHDNIVIAIVNNELTVKRLYKKGGVVELRPENDHFPVITFKGGMELLIWGVVSGVTRKT